MNTTVRSLIVDKYCVYARCLLRVPVDTMPPRIIRALGGTIQEDDCSEAFPEFTTEEKEYLDTFEGKVITSLFEKLKETIAGNNGRTGGICYHVPDHNAAYRVLAPYYRQIFEEFPQVQGIVYSLLEKVPEEQLIIHRITRGDEYFRWITGDHDEYEFSDERAPEDHGSNETCPDADTNPETAETSGSPENPD